jgi:hypothetical protein
MIKIASRSLPLCALLLASCGGSTTGGTPGTAGTGAGTAGTSGGTAGTTGSTGSAGTSGTGTAGTTGNAGTTGSAGSVGTGTGGTTGSAGNAGNAGTTGGGATGGSATTGSAGTSGNAGNVGTTGSAGTSGSAGRGGTTGSAGNGSAGRGGTTGTAGTGGSSSAGTGGSTSTGTGGQVACAPPTVTLPSGNDAVAGTRITFNDNGGWCWYQDERAVVDTKNNKLVIATTASGGSRNGTNEVVVYDLATSMGKTFKLPSTLSTNNVDEHNSPALLVRPDGKYLAMWSGHRVDCISRTSIFDGTAWSAEKKIDWTPWGCPWAGASTNMVTYSNPWYIGSNIYAMVRSVGTDPAVLTSADDGGTFSYYGRLMDTVQTGYVAGYFKYWGNNTDRIDFVGTEAHPRDADTSLYHGYISGGKVYNSTGTVKDSSLMDTNATTTTSVNINTYTAAFKTGTTVKNTKLCRMWNHDIVRYADGTVAILGQGRADNCTSTPSDSDPDKRIVYLRFDGTSWKATYLVKAGPKLYPDEQDYTGLSALDPDDPHTIYVSTIYDPRDDTTKSTKREIWRGTTCDNGATFSWTQVTARSTADNIRPIVPKWDSSHTALLWLNGTYSTAQSYALKVVGLIGPKN